MTEKLSPAARVREHAAGARRRFAAWMLLLLGSVAMAAMLPAFAVFVPVVAAAWIAARLGFLPKFLGHRHPGARLAPGPDAAVTTFTATLESEASKGPDEHELLATLVARADAIAAPRASPACADCITWRPSAPRDVSALPLDDWPHVREALARGDALVIATRSNGNGNGRGVRRIEAMVGGDRALLEALALGYGDELRSAGVEIVTTGWLRHAERVRAARMRGRG